MLCANIHPACGIVYIKYTINNVIICKVIFIFCCFHPAMCFAVSDADGDTVRCRWAESAQRECSEVCKHFKISLDQVSYFLFYHHSHLKIPKLLIRDGHACM